MEKRKKKKRNRRVRRLESSEVRERSLYEGRPCFLHSGGCDARSCIRAGSMRLAVAFQPFLRCMHMYFIYIYIFCPVVSRLDFYEYL